MSKRRQGFLKPKGMETQGPRKRFGREYQRLGEVVFMLRTINRVSCIDLAEAIGMKRDNTIRNMETGYRAIHAFELDAILAAFKTSMPMQTAIDIAKAKGEIGHLFAEHFRPKKR